jgi:uncharacterized iron-regulated membrane protein
VILSPEDIDRLEASKREAKRPFLEKHRALAIVCGALLFCAVLAGVTWLLRSLFPVW